MDIIIDVAAIVLLGLVAIGGIWYSDPEDRRLRVENWDVSKRKNQKDGRGIA